MRRFLFSCGLVFASPWWWMLMLHPQAFGINNWQPLGFRDQIFLETVNKYQGLSGKRWIINKYTWMAREFFDRAVEIGNPRMLFFSGDPDHFRSTRENGALYLSLTVAVVIGIRRIKDKRIKLLCAAVGIFGIIGAGMAKSHYYTPAWTPVFVMYAVLAANGVETIIKTWKTNLQAVYGGWIALEMIWFAHNLIFHYLPNMPI